MASGRADEISSSGPIPQCNSARSSVKCQVHAVLAGAGVPVPMSDLFGVGGQQLLQRVELPRACRPGLARPSGCWSL